VIPFEKIKTIFFDYDGTLHNSIKIYAPAFRKAYAFLVEQGYANEKVWNDNQISYWLGFNPSDMWSSFMPELKQEVRSQCSKIIGEEMTYSIENGKAELYDGALEVLEQLKAKGIRLVFISNCKNYYKDSHNKLFKLDKYFEELASSEEYAFISKFEILKAIKHKYEDAMVIVGDRKQDIEAGKKNNIYTIGCSYGFAVKGELDEADLIIDNIKALKHL
jgi:haloacid dehalogenase superfamily, subfamily IA, variant 1 with third motif having Dx(3-4)D or Dx(3-4)E